MSERIFVEIALEGAVFAAVYAEDAQPSSGINHIYFKAVSAVGNKETVINESKQVYSDNTAIFIVPANFKGQIMARADDNVGNHVDTFVTPSGTIIEAPEQHEQEKHIFINPKIKSSNTSHKV